MSIAYLSHISNKVIDNQPFIQLIFFDHKSQTMIFWGFLKCFDILLRPIWIIRYK